MGPHARLDARQMRVLRVMVRMERRGGAGGDDADDARSAGLGDADEIDDADDARPAGLGDDADDARPAGLGDDADDARSAGLGDADGADTPTRGGILACHAGFGKTHVTCTLCRVRPRWPVLIVVPTAVVCQWVDVLHACGFGGDVVRVVLKKSPERALEAMEYASKATDPRRVVVTTHHCAEVFLDERMPVAFQTWGRLLIDEAHVAKNPATKLHATFKKLGQRVSGGRVWALTATPIQNCVRDILSLAAVIGIRSRIDTELLTSRFMISAPAIQEGAACVPEEEEEDRPLSVVKKLIVLPPGSWDAEVYAQTHAAYARTAAQCGSHSKPGLEMQMHCMQAATHPEIYFATLYNKQQPSDQAKRTGGATAWWDGLEANMLRARGMRVTSPHGTSPKVAFLVGDILACSPDENGVLVYCEWHSEMKLIREELLSQGVRCFEYNGKMALCERDDAVRSFRSAVAFHERGAEARPPCVMIIQSKSGSVGLNLQDSASRLYIMRPQYNPSVEYQSICHIHRRGQTRPVTVIQLVAVGTIDEVCFERQTAKLSCISQVMNDDEMTRILRNGGGAAQKNPEL
ncbi:hypothetical protein FOA52_005972 [Chlamydomonas sp. UWO 241]|nr:hypothetical protein FOA52_005972 [Chlamydomonas sp. UWO 241]